MKLECPVPIHARRSEWFRRQNARNNLGHEDILSTETVIWVGIVVVDIWHGYGCLGADILHRGDF